MTCLSQDAETYHVTKEGIAYAVKKINVNTNVNTNIKKKKNPKIQNNFFFAVYLNLKIIIKKKAETPCQLFYMCLPLD